jgi:hypothetical protein
MRISALALSHIGILFLMPFTSALATPICGVFVATVYAPSEKGGREVIANPKAVSSTKLVISSGENIPKEQLGKLLQIHFRSKSMCYLKCEVELIKVVKAVSPFDPLPSFYRDKDSLVKDEPCVKNAAEATGL